MVLFLEFTENTREWECSKWGSQGCISKRTSFLLIINTLKKFLEMEEQVILMVWYLFQDMTLAISNAREPESEEKPQKSLNDKQQVSGHWHMWSNLQLNAYLKSCLVFHFLLFFLQSAGEPGHSGQMHISKFGIFWGKTSCCLCHIQMPSSLEVIWSWKNYCFWPDYSNNSFSLRGKSKFCGFERYVSVH